MCQVSSEKIAEMGAGEIAAAIREGEATAVGVVEALIARIEALNDRLNAVIVPLFESARREAREADSRRAGGASEELPPLFGVPVTIKDQFFVSGTPVSCGLAHRSDEVFDQQGTLVTRLRENGAIILGKTNVPQLLISHECRHARYGPAKNPFDEGRTPGGSSGGEAAIIAAGGSPLGLGGDMGGSVRIPSHFCGVSGLKPTGGRLPNDDSPFFEGHVGDLVGFEGIIVQPGPLARRVDDLKLAMDCFAGEPLPQRSLTPPVPWRTGPISEVDGIRVGTYVDDGYFTPCPAIRRVVARAALALEENGNPVAGFSVPDPAYAARLYVSLLVSDGGAWIREALDGERPIGDVEAILRVGGAPLWLRRMLAGLMRATGQEYAARALSASGRCSAREYWRLTAERTRYRMRFVDEMDRAGVDVLVCPPHPLPAFRLDGNRNGVETATALYAALFNLVGLPAGVVAAGRVGAEEESDRPASRDRVIRDAIAMERGSAGMPVGVQVVGRHWREDQVLAVMRYLEERFAAEEDYPVGAAPPP
ncbi:MAG: amidase family protein [Polyangia bacterium]